MKQKEKEETQMVRSDKRRPTKEREEKGEKREREEIKVISSGITITIHRPTH